MLLRLIRITPLPPEFLSLYLHFTPPLLAVAVAVAVASAVFIDDAAAVSANVFVAADIAALDVVAAASCAAASDAVDSILLRNSPQIIRLALLQFSNT